MSAPSVYMQLHQRPGTYSIILLGWHSDTLRIAMLVAGMACHRALQQHCMPPVTCIGNHETLVGVHERQGNRSQGGTHGFHS